MPEPIVELTVELDLPFMREQEEAESNEDEEVDDEDAEDADPDEVLKRMQSAVPADAVCACLDFVDSLIMTFACASAKPSRI